MLDWLQAILLLPGRLIIYLLVAISPGVHGQLSNGVVSLYGWPPVVGSIAIYGVFTGTIAGWLFMSFSRKKHKPKLKSHR